MPETYCTNCGTALREEQRFCGTCGQSIEGPVPGSVAAMARSAPQTSGKATASLVLGIAGFLVFPLVCSILAIVLGNQAKQEIAADPRLGGESAANAGVILGWIGIAFALAGAIFFLFVVSSMHP